MAFRGSKPSKRSPFLPVIGLILLIVAGAIAWFLSDPAYGFLRDNVQGIPAQAVMRYIIAVAIFLVEILLVAAVYALFQPRTPRMVTEQELDREKQERLREREASDRRKKQMREKLREQSRRK